MTKYVYKYRLKVKAGSENLKICILLCRFKDVFDRYLEHTNGRAQVIKLTDDVAWATELIHESVRRVRE